MDGHSCKEIMSLYQANPFSTRHRSGTEYLRPSPFLYRAPSPPLLAPCPQTPPLFSRISMAPGRPPHVPVSMFDLPLMAPLVNRDDDKETLEYAAAIDGWCTWLCCISDDTGQVRMQLSIQRHRHQHHPWMTEQASYMKSSHLHLIRQGRLMTSSKRKWVG